MQLRRRLLRHRRSIAAVLAGLSVLLLGAALSSADDVRAVVVARNDLGAGEVIDAGDLQTIAVPVAMVPQGSVATPAAIEQRVLSSAVRAGEILTDVRFLGDGLLAAAEPGIVAVPIRLHDPSTVRILRTGDTIDVLAAAGAEWDDSAGRDDAVARVVAEAVTVLSTHPGGTTASTLSDAGDGVIVAALTQTEARSVAAAVVTGQLSFVLRADTADG